MYLDANVIILKSFDSLRMYNLVEGREFTIANGILIAEPWSFSLRLHIDITANIFKQEKLLCMLQ